MNGAIHRRTAVKFVAAATAALGASSIPLLARAAQVGSPEPVEPGAGAWRTWFLMSGADLRPSPPPDSQSELSQVRRALGAYALTSSIGVTSAEPSARDGTERIGLVIPIR